MVNCLEYALDYWNENKDYKIHYNSDHCINLPEDCKIQCFLPIEQYGFGYFENWFKEKLIPKRSYKLLIDYFKTYEPGIPVYDITISNTKEIGDMSSLNKGQAYNIYCDGSCAVHSTQKGRWAFVVVNDKEEAIFQDGFTFENTTNSEMEVNGLYQSLKFANDHLQDDNVTIYCDSSYVVQGYNDWCEGWRSKGWKKANKAPVAFTNVWIEIDKIRSSKIKVEWVKGHSDNKWNNYVDSLTRNY